MRDLVRRALDSWRRAQRPEASPAEIREALAVIPQLGAALDGVAWISSAVRGGGSGREPVGEAERFARHLSHELRNRLNLVQLSLERASVVCDDARVHEALEPVRKALGHLAGVTDELRSVFDPAPSVRDPSARQPLKTAIEDVLAATRDLAEARGVSLEVAGEPPDLEVDAVRLELILINLLNNALRHADPGKETRWVRIECRRLDGESACRIGIVDNGSGIPEGLRTGLFEEPARDGDGSPPRSGMGLAIVRQAVERDGGRVWIESEEGEGTAVYFTLPVPEASPGPAALPPRRAQAEAG